MKVLFLLTCLAASVAVCSGQANKSVKPDLTGTWELDHARHNVTQSKNILPEQIKIRHHDPELVIRRQIRVKGVPEERELTYYTDGRGETNPPAEWLTSQPFDESWRPTETISKTTWSKDKVVTRSVSRAAGGATYFEFEVFDEWQLSSHGKKLTQITRTNPKKDSMANAVFATGSDMKRVYKLVSK